MTTATITPPIAPIVETYYDVEKLIYHICNRFLRKYGGDFEEMVGEANLIYMKVYKIWKPERGMSFTSLLCTCIYRKLLKIRNITNKKSKIWNTSLNDLLQENTCSRSVDDLSIMEDKSPVIFDEDNFLKDFTSDAQTIIQFILQEPQEIKLRVEEKGGQYRNWRSVIRMYLKEIGWTAKRISESFEEIRRMV